MPLKTAWLYSPSLRRVPLGQQDQEDHENPANMRRPLRKKYFMLIICNRKSTFPLIDQLELVCFSVVPDSKRLFLFFFFFPPVLICSETLLTIFIVSGLWCLGIRFTRNIIYSRTVLLAIINQDRMVCNSLNACCYSICSNMVTCSLVAPIRSTWSLFYWHKELINQSYSWVWSSAWTLRVKGWRFNSQLCMLFQCNNTLSRAVNCSSPLTSWADWKK